MDTPTPWTALKELVESHDALLNPASNRGEPAIGSALVDRLGAAWLAAQRIIKDTETAAMTADRRDKGREYLRGFADGLHRAHDVAVQVTSTSVMRPDEAAADIKRFLGLEVADAQSHADVGECIATLLNEQYPRCPLWPDTEEGP